MTKRLKKKPQRLKKMSKKDQAGVVLLSMRVQHLKTSFARVAMQETEGLDDRVRWAVIARAVLGHFQDFFGTAMAKVGRSIDERTLNEQGPT